LYRARNRPDFHFEIPINNWARFCYSNIWFWFEQISTCHIRITKLAEEGAISFEDASSQMAEQQEVRRFGEPAEIAAVVAFLASDKANYCQGTTLDVDGGQSKTL
jgi:enoyl-[acyl-carrier-protein] reductase (NADH)